MVLNPMTNEEENVLLIKGMIASLSAAEQEACNDLAEHIRRQIKCAGEPVGALAIALVGSEIQQAHG